MIIGASCDGGGGAGVLQAGMLWRLNALRDRIQFIDAASVGGLNSVMFVQNEIDEMLGMWRGLRRKDVIKYRWPFPPALWRDGVFSTAPLRRLINKHVNLEKLRASHITMFVRAVELRSGRVRVATQHDEDFVDVLLAGASLPCAFPPVKMGDTYWCDGGVEDNTPRRELIDAGCDTIFGLHCHPFDATPYTGKPPSVKQQASMLLRTCMNAAQSADSKTLERINAAVQAGTDTNGYRKIDVYEVYPTIGVGTMEFDGRNAETAINNGCDAMTRMLNLLNW